MAERVGNERVRREEGYLYFVGKDGYVWKTSRENNLNGRKLRVTSKKIKKEDGYLYFLDKGGYISRRSITENATASRNGSPNTENDGLLASLIEPYNYKCKVCNFRSKSEAEMREHIKSKHNALLKSVKPESKLSNGKMLSLVIVLIFTAVLPPLFALYVIEAFFKKRLHDLRWLNLLYFIILSITLFFVALTISWIWWLYLVGLPIIWIYKERVFKQVYKPLKKSKPILSSITYRQRGNKRILYGGLAVIAGIVITLISLGIALGGGLGGWYLVWFGPVLFGGYEFLKGLIDITHPKDEYIPIGQDTKLAVNRQTKEVRMSDGRLYQKWKEEHQDELSTVEAHNYERWLKSKE